MYAPITKNQEKQTKIITEGQQNQLEAIQNQTDEIKAITSLPSTISYTNRKINNQLLNLQSEDEFHDSGDSINRSVIFNI